MIAFTESTAASTNSPRVLRSSIRLGSAEELASPVRPPSFHRRRLISSQATVISLTCSATHAAAAMRLLPTPYQHLPDRDRRLPSALFPTFLSLNLHSFANLST